MTVPPAEHAAGMYTLVEPIHLITYFTPQAAAAFEAAGLRGFWRGYFAGRTAVLGAVGPAPVVALFYGFAPAMVARALPEVWSRLVPQAALAARRDGAVAALRALLPDEAAVGRAAEPLARIAESVESGGRALGAANAALPRDEDPYGLLWQAATTLREHRGDGHVAALVIAGLSGLESVVLRAGIDLDRRVMQVARGWTDEQWDAGVRALQGRGLLDAEGSATPSGQALIGQVEDWTNQAAGVAWRVPDSADPEAWQAQVQSLAAELLPLARACQAALPTATPLGELTPWDPAEGSAPDRFAGRLG